MQDDQTPDQPAQTTTQSPVTSSSTPPPLWRQRPFQIVAAVVVVIVIALLVVILGSGGDNNSGISVKRASYPDYLTPTSVIKVGDYRYVSPCQALPEATVTKLFGNFPAESVVQEHYIDQSVPNTANGAEVDSSCTYNSVDGDKHLVRLGVDQVGTADQWKTENLLSKLQQDEDASVLTKKVTSYKNASGVLSSPDAKAFVSLMTDSAARYQKAVNFESDSDTILDNTIVPDTSAADGTSFIGTWKNVVYTIELERGSSKALPLSQQLAKMYQAYKVVKANLADAKLSQSPSPTVRGDTTKVGQLTVLEPCRLLDSSIMTSLLNVPQNDITERTSLPLDITTVRHAQNKNRDVLPQQNTCVRNYLASNLPSDDAGNPILATAGEQDYGVGGTANISLELDYSHDHAAANSLWKSYTGTVTDPSTQYSLKTAADSAYIDGSTPELTIAYFRIGDYIGVTSFDNTHSDDPIETGDTITPDNSTFVKLINDIVANYKAVYPK